MKKEKIVRASYTLEYKLEAVRLVQGGQACAVTAKILGIPKQTLDNWIKLAEKGKLTGVGTKPISAEQMELARLRAGSRACPRQDGARHLKKRPPRRAEPLLYRNMGVSTTACRLFTMKGCLDNSRLLLGGLRPRQKLGLGESADPSVVAHYCDPV